MEHLEMNLTIHDGDHGGDDFIATLAILARSDIFQLLGISTCGGNIDAKTAARNALIACKLSGREDIPVYVGSNESFIGRPFPGDEAHGVDGIGGATFTEPSKQPNCLGASKWMVETIEKSSSKVTIFATGPLTNIAISLRNAPHIKNNIDKLIIMGGAFGHPGGNITSYSEFNFAMDPDAAKYVLDIEGLQRTLLPLDATHSLCFDPQIQRKLTEMNLLWGDSLIKMMREAEKYDMPRFKSLGAFLHDPQVVFYAIDPDLYLLITSHVNINTSDHELGRSTLDDNGSASKIAIGCKNIDKVVNLFYKSFVKLERKG